MNPFDLTENERCRWRAWQESVLEHSGRRCSVCGSTDHLIVLPVVPLPVSSLRRESGYVLCRSCHLTSLKGRTGARDRPVTLWMGRKLHDAVRALLDGDACPYSSFSRLASDLISSCASHPEQYHDLALYQDDGRDVKVTLRVEQNALDSLTARFHELTLTAALKALLLIYLQHTRDRHEQSTEDH